MNTTGTVTTRRRAAATATAAAGTVGAPVIPPRDRQLLVVWAAALLWLAVFTYLAGIRHTRFATYDFDLGIHDQAIWLMARGHWSTLVTVRGTPALGHHATFAYYLLAPLSWLGAGPLTWNLIHNAALAACGPVLTAIARTFGLRKWAAASAGLAWLLNPWIGFYAWETFHPEVVGTPFLLLAVWLFRRNRTAWAFASLVMAMCWKEDLALALIGIGVLCWLWGKRRTGVAVVVLGLVWFALLGSVFVPHMAGGGTVYQNLFGELGHTPLEVIVNSVRNPMLPLRHLAQANAGVYFLKLAVPFALLCVAAPVAVLVGLPAAMVNLLSVNDFTYDLRYHYQVVPLASVALASTIALARLRRFHRVVVPALVLAAAVAHVGWGIGPASTGYDDGYWPRANPTEAAFLHRAINRIGPTDGVSSDYRVVPHVSQRLYAYTFPNPWRNRNFGINPDDHGDPAHVRWILVAEDNLSPTDLAVFHSLLAGNQYREVDRSGPWVLAERTA